MTKKILIVNCYFDELRFPVRRQTKFPQTMGPVYLAGAFSDTRCEIRLYNEQFSGPLENEALLAFPDMLVLTGLDTAFDRMLHLTAYARTRNPDVVVVAGGPAIRALYRFSQNFFDYCCTGDIEQLKDVIEDSFGRDYVAQSLLEKGWALPRYDLAYWAKIGSYVESSRNCFYQCGFCSLTAEKGEYTAYDIEYLNLQFERLGRQKYVLFIDNNFGSTSRRFIHERFDLLKDLRARGYFKKWLAMVSQEFITDENIDMCRETGCFGLFSGVETFDEASIAKFKKFQNSRLPQVDAITKCLNAGIVFNYGMLLDVSERTISDLKNELEFILNTPEIPLPAYISVAVPMLKTDYFYDCVENDLLLPNVKIRDLDSTTLTVKPMDPMDRAVDFIKQIQNLAGYRRKVLKHTWKFYRIYRKQFSLPTVPSLFVGPMLLCTPRLGTLGFDFILNGFKKHNRTFVGSTEPLDSVYRPAFNVDSRYAHYFQPTMLTDGRGYISEELVPDLLETPAENMKIAV